MGIPGSTSGAGGVISPVIMNGTSPSISVETLLSHQAWVRALARSLVRDPAAAEDLGQEAMLAALRTPPRDGIAVRAWFRRVLRNRLLNRVRSRARRASREVAAARPEAGPPLEPSIERVERHRQVVNLVLDLPGPFRETVVLRFFDNLTTREIGERLGVPGSTVRSRLTRALAMLRERLDEEHGGSRGAGCVALLPLLSDRPIAGAVGSTALGPGGAVIMGTNLKILVAALALVFLLAGLGILLGGGGDQPPPPASRPETAALLSPPPPLFGEAPLYRTDAPPPVRSGGTPGEPWSAGLAADAQARALFDAAMAHVLPLLRELGDVEAYLAGREPRGVRLSLSEEARELLLRVARTGDPGERTNAVLALAAATELRDEDLRFLEQRLDIELAAPGESRVALALAWTLDRHGDRRGLEALADAVRSPRVSGPTDFRREATLLLALADDPESAPMLRDLMARDQDRMVRKHAAAGLGRLGDDESRRVLADALPTETDAEVRAWAALAIGRAGKGLAGGDPALHRAMTTDEAGLVRAAAAYGLGRASGEGVEEALEAAYRRETNPLAKLGAVAGLVGRGAEPTRFLAEEGLPFLAATAVGSEDAVERYFSTSTLRRLPASAERGAALRRVAAEDPVEWIRREALTAIALTEGAAAVHFLRQRLVAEPSPRLKRGIRAALESLGEMR
jgi:RNA polymerase sigma-70 factor (ECF subfamily)